MDAVIYDKKRKEYVTKLYRKVLSDDLVYKTTPDPAKAMIVKKDDKELKQAASALNYDVSLLEYRPATREAEVNQASDEVAGMIQKYAWKYDERKDSEQLILKVLTAFENNFGIDTDAWKEDLSENLDQAYDE